MKDMLINLGNAAAEYLRLKGIEPFMNKAAYKELANTLALLQSFARGTEFRYVFAQKETTPEKSVDAADVK